MKDRREHINFSTKFFFQFFFSAKNKGMITKHSNISVFVEKNPLSFQKYWFDIK